MEFLAGLPHWAISALVGAVCGAAGVLIGYPFKGKTQAIIGVIAIVIGGRLLTPVVEDALAPHAYIVGLKSEVAKMQFPIQMEELIVLSKVEVTGRTIDYHYELADEFVDNALQALTDFQKPTACRAFKQWLDLGYLQQANYHMTDTAGKRVMASFVAKDCQS